MCAVNKIYMEVCAVCKKKHKYVNPFFCVDKWGLRPVSSYRKTWLSSFYKTIFLSVSLQINKFLSDPVKKHGYKAV
jgi:hypothetical protein